MSRVISTPNAPTGNAAGPFPYSQAVVAGGLVFVAGQGPVDPATGALVGDTIQEQTRQAMRNVEAILEAAGSSTDRIVNVLFLLAESGRLRRSERGVGALVPDEPARPERGQVPAGDPQLPDLAVGRSPRRARRRKRPRRRPRSN